MDIHKPHAPHSWGEFAREIATIVTGILIALALEQGLAWLHERHLADEARTAIRAELAWDMAAFSTRATGEPCVRRRLAEIDVALRHWASGEAVPPMWIGQPSNYGFDSSRFESASTTGRFALLPAHEQTVNAQLHRFIDGAGRFQIAEIPIWGRLQGLRGGSTGLTDADRARIAGTLDEARAYDDLVVAIARFAPALARREGIAFRPLPLHADNGDATCLPVTTTAAEAARLLEYSPLAGE